MPDPFLPRDLDQIASETPVQPQGLASLRALLRRLPPLTPVALPGVSPALLPEDDGTTASTGGAPGAGSPVSDAFSGPPPGSIPGTAIASGTLPHSAFVTNVSAPWVWSTSPLPTLPSTTFPEGSLLVWVPPVGDGKLYRVVESAWTRAIDGAAITDGGDIIANSVTTGAIAVGAITASELASKIVLTTQLIAGIEEASHAQIDEGGIILYDDALVPIAKLPTDGSTAFFKGALEAATLVSLASAQFRGSSVVAAGGTLTFAGGTSAPTAAPVLTQGPLVTYALSFGQSDLQDRGLAWDPASSTWYAAYWRSGDGDYAKIRELNGTTFAQIRSVAASADIADLVRGVGVSSTHVYVAIYNDPVLKLKKFLRSDLSFVSEATITADVARIANASMFYDATADRLVVVTATGTGAGKQTRFRLYNQSLVLQSTIDDSSGGFTFNADTTFSAGGVRAEGYYWIPIHKDGGSSAGVSEVRAFNLSTGAYVANQDFGCFDGPYAFWAGLGLGHNGSNFFGLRNPGGTACKFSNWNWTTESNLYWLGYAWYDPDGTTHETELGPRASSPNMVRRMALQVVNSTIPGGGGVDDPDNVRVYMVRNVSGEPAPGNYKLQVTDALTSRFLDSYNASGEADKTSNNFPASSPAKITGLDPVVRVYTSGATWSKPSNLHHVVVECVGGGGGGGGAAATTGIAQGAGGAGGGGGGYARKTVLAGSLGSSETVTIGAGGEGGMGGAAGTAGTASSFGTHCVGYGGGAGGVIVAGSTHGTQAAGGAGATGSGDLVVDGSDGTNCHRMRYEVDTGDGSGAINAWVIAGAGGASHLGGAVRAAIGSNAGNDGKPYGGGGSGAANHDNNSARDGGWGYQGIVIVTELYGP